MTFLWLMLLISNLIATGAVNNYSSPLECVSPLRTFDPHRHKRLYRVGVHAIRGFDAAVQEYNKTFGQYLSMTAGRRFDPPIEFEMVPVDFQGIYTAAESEEVDFFYANPSIFSCVGTELGAEALATIVSRLEVRGHTYDLDVFGGVIATRKGNDEINTLKDLKGKVIGCGSISMVMSSQLQFYEMEKAGVSYVMDPKQVVFTGNQNDVVSGILSGEFDVGFVRTDQIERTTDAKGNLIDPDLFKIIEPKIFVLDDGNLFPFLHSTQIYPEWPLAALTHVPDDVAQEVQSALLAVGQHAHVGRVYDECIAANGEEYCKSLPFPPDSDVDRRCDTTKEIAKLAWEASQEGKWAGFRTSRSYFELRTMQEKAGFITEDENGQWKCVRSSSIYDIIKCPPGHFKRSQEDFETGCQQAGIPCKEGYDCYCKPCIKAFEVEVYDYIYGTVDHHLSDGYFGKREQGCEKMSICGQLEQTKTLTLRALDNLARPDTNFTALLHVGGEREELQVTRLPQTFVYEFNVTAIQVGFNVIEIFANGEQIKESPILVEVVDRNCAADFVGEKRVPDFEGSCVCNASATEIRGKCITSTIIFSTVAGVVLLIALQIGYMYLNYKKRQGDTMWIVSVDELHFSEPVDIIGQGSFGVVLLAEYRGTKVAVKRVLPPHGQRGPSDSNSGGSASADALSDHSPVEHVDLESQEDVLTSKDSFNFHGIGSFSWNKGSPTSKMSKWFSKWHSKNEIYAENTNVLLSSTSSSSSSRLYAWCPIFDKHSQQKKDFIEEMRLLSRLRHPCITTVMGAVMSPVHEPMLVMEYMDYGSLYDLLRNETMHTGGEVILQIVRDIAQGLRYLHASKPPILHGDLKSKNILVDSRFRAKVGDFGLSTKKKNGIHGTPYWMAPEYLQGRTEYGVECDMYSLGIVFYEIYARKNPYEGENPRYVLYHVCNPRTNKRPAIPEQCPTKMADIMKKCWSPDPFFRPSSKELDLMFMDMNIQDVEPLEKEVQNFKHIRTERPTKEVLYEVFPKHIADALNAGKKVEPESHEIVTVVFSDIVGFTDISSEISPMKVSNMLDRLYLAFDQLASKHGIFKVETIGDAYMGVTNLNGSQKDDHAKRIAKFGLDLIDAAGKIAIDEDNPKRGFINVRVGFHSGPVVSNVIGSLNPRYGLFGDTVNTASRMETNSEAARVLCSDSAAAILKKQAPEISLTKRKKIGVKGKGNMVTYWVGGPERASINLPGMDINGVGKRVAFEFDDVNISGIECGISEDFTVQRNNKLKRHVSDASSDAASKSKSVDERGINENLQDSFHMKPEDRETDRLINCIMAILVDSIKKVISVHDDCVPSTEHQNQIQSAGCCLDEAKLVVVMPKYDVASARALNEYNAVHIPPKVVADLREFVTLIASTYRNNPFHNFKHCCHATIAMHKLIQLILTPNFGTEQLQMFARSGKDQDHLLHEFSYGISSDPMALFAMVFTTLIHDVDHRGISNAQLVKEEPDMAKKYRCKSVAEQNSFDIAWEIFMFDQFKDMRQFIFGSTKGLLRFRQLVVKMMMATDMFDKESKDLREETWDRAFGTQCSDPFEQRKSENLNDTRANIMLEHIIQACDVSHTMQHWNVYQKWNKSLFLEMQDAFQQGRLNANPVDFWYQGELVFFDVYIIPLARKLKESNMLGTSSDDCLNYAMSNRAQWASQGQGIIHDMATSFDGAKGGSDEKKQ